MSNDTRVDTSPHVVETLRQILVAGGALTHAFGRALSGPMTSGLSSNADIAVLVSLRLVGPQRPRELRDRAALTAGGLSNLCDRLERRRLVTRVYGGADGDRRSALVSLTTHGGHVAGAIADEVRLTITEQATLLQRIRSLIDSITAPPPVSPAMEPARSPLVHIERIARFGIDLAAALAHCDPHEPTPATATVVLCAAATPDGTRPRNLLEITDLSSGGVTMLFDRLERGGLVQRTTRQLPDRRAVTVALTDLGRRDLRHRLVRITGFLPRIRSAFTFPDVATGCVT